MAEKKDTKKINKIIKSVSAKDAQKKDKIVKKQEKTQQKEQQFFVKELAEKLGIGSYDLFLIKRDAGIKDDSLITMSEIQKLYNKVVGR